MGVGLVLFALGNVYGSAVVGEAEVEFLVAALDERERVVVVGQAFTEEAEPTLRRLSTGLDARSAAACEDLLDNF